MHIATPKKCVLSHQIRAPEAVVADCFFLSFLSFLPVVFFLERTTLIGSGVLVRGSSGVSYGVNDDRRANLGRLPPAVELARSELAFAAITVDGLTFEGISPSLSTIKISVDEKSCAVALRIGF